MLSTHRKKKVLVLGMVAGVLERIEAGRQCELGQQLRDEIRIHGLGLDGKIAYSRATD